MQKSTKRLTRWFRNASWVAGFFAVVALVVVAMTLAHPLMGGQERSRSTTAKKAKTDSSGKKKKAITGLVADTFQESLSFKSGHSGPVRSVAFSPDGKRLASAGGFGGKLDGPSAVKIWDAVSGKEILTLNGHSKCVYSVMFSLDGKRLASASSDGTVKVRDATNGQEALTLEASKSGVYSVAFSPDGKQLAADSNLFFDKPGVVKLWDATSGQEMLTLEAGGGDVTSVAFSSDGSRLAAASANYFDKKFVDTPGNVKLWNARSGQQILTLDASKGGFHSVAFSPDGKRLVAISGYPDEAVRLWDATSGQETLTLKGEIVGHVNCVVFSPDGKWLASGSGYPNNCVKLWDSTSGLATHTLRLNGSDTDVYSVAFSPDGKRLAAATKNGWIKVWGVPPRS